MEILKVHTRNKPLADDVNLEDIARKMIGMTGADLRNLANEAAMLATREDKQTHRPQRLRTGRRPRAHGAQARRGASAEGQEADRLSRSRAHAGRLAAAGQPSRPRRCPSCRAAGRRA